MKSRSLAASLQGYSLRTNHHEIYRPRNRSAFFCTNRGYRKIFWIPAAVAQESVRLLIRLKRGQQLLEICLIRGDGVGRPRKLDEDVAAGCLDNRAEKTVTWNRAPGG